eukprot:3407371-Rhodomonas_salina.1
MASDTGQWSTPIEDGLRDNRNSGADCQNQAVCAEPAACADSASAEPARESAPALDSICGSQLTQQSAIAERGR